MSSLELVGLPSGFSLLTLICSRIRCLCKPDREGCHFQSGCTDAPLQKDDHEIDVVAQNLNGRDVLVVSAKE